MHSGFAYKRGFDAFVDFFWPLCPSALHDLQQYHRQQQQQQQQQGGSGSSGAGSDGCSEGAVAASRAAAERILQAAHVPEYQLGRTKHERRLFMAPAFNGNECWASLRNSREAQGAGCVAPATICRVPGILLGMLRV
eukprot:1158890-Pelagomonas_calceolata.AAC.5